MESVGQDGVRRGGGGGPEKRVDGLTGHVGFRFHKQRHPFGKVETLGVWQVVVGIWVVGVKGGMSGQGEASGRGAGETEVVGSSGWSGGEFATDWRPVRWQVALHSPKYSGSAMAW